MSTLEEKYQEQLTKYRESRDLFQDYVNIEGYEDYRILPNHSYDCVSIQIEHKVFNWTNFISCNILKDDFSFSHGSGGWNDSATTDDKLNAITDMINLVKHFQTIKDEIFARYLEVSKIETELSNRRRKLNDSLKDNMLQEAYLEIEKTHDLITDNQSILNDIENGGHKIMYKTYIDYKNEIAISKIEVSNRKTSRNSYYFNEESYSKSNLIQTLEDNRYYSLKEQ